MDEPVTLITGTRTGIGKFLVGHFLRSGHRVIGCSRGKADYELDGYSHHVADVRDEKAIKAMFSEVRRSYGRVDHLINNAGVASMNHALLTPLSTVRDVLDTNVAGTFLLCREAAKLMTGRHYGRIVNFTTVAVPLKLAGEAAYVASKAAVVALTEVLARELAEFGITVNAIGPAPVETAMIHSMPKEKIDRLLARQAIPRLATLADIANVVDFFLRRESTMVTGQVVFLGGV